MDKSHEFSVELEIVNQGRMSLIRGGGNVKRWHTTPVVGEQTVAAHTWGVMVIIDQLYPDAGAALWRAALYHDVTEKFTGDSPADAKWRNPRLKALLDEVEDDIALALGINYPISGQDKLRLSVADKFEMLWFCVEQRKLGNFGNIDLIWKRVRSWLEQNIPRLTNMDHTNALTMWHEVHQKWNQAS